MVAGTFGPLISPEALLERLGDERLAIADVRWYLLDPARGRLAYAAGHIPGAVFVDVDSDLAGPTGPGRHPLPEPAAFADRMSALGIGDETLVVAYDDTGGGTAARLWWMLDDLGHSVAAVLDGGLDAWLRAGGPIAPDVPVPQPRPLHLRDRWSRVADAPGVASRLGTAILLDGRSPERYRGDIEPVDPIAGHIPTAINVPIASNLGGEGRFLGADELALRYRTLGAGDVEVIASCGSGVNACQTILAMRVAGLPDPLLYEGSYSDWSRTGRPVATGPEPGSPPSPPSAPGPGRLAAPAD